MNSEFLFRFPNSDFRIDLVGTSGLEPPTSRLSGVRSNHLSYAPISLELLLFGYLRSYPSLTTWWR